MATNLNSLCNLQKKELNVSLDVSQRTYLVAVFIDNVNPCKNRLLNIPCEKGIAISGYSYDCTSDFYVKECFDYYRLGSVQGAAFLHIHNSWEVRIPLSSKLCMKLMDKTQKKLLKDFIKINDYDNLSVEFLQMVGD